MKLRKILAVVLALALLCTTLAACGNDSGSSNSSGSNSSSAETGDTATGPSGGTLNQLEQLAGHLCLRLYSHAGYD